MNRKAFLACVLMCVILTGCETAKKISEVIKNPDIQVGSLKEQPSEITVTLLTEPDTNTNAEGESAAVDVQLVYLTDDSKLLAADYDQIASTPLLGMVMRLSTMNSQTMPEHLFAQVVTDVQAVEQLLQEQGYEPGVIISFRYILCTFIDEAALGNGWSNKNEWIKQSLLVHFHNEAWGGEKVFILLERLIREPKRYQDLLEFLWICFSLGFRGRYKVAAQDQGEFEQIYRRLYHVLHKLRGDAPFPLLHQDKKTQGGRYQLISRLTVKHIFCGGVVVLALFYLFYLLRLDSQTQDILHQLNKLLR
ncbi:type IVB secretion system protein IcmH/DotU [Escherichia coli]|nr:type IVB secretion system protein IcmH/DotU [Escherichia coli]EFK4689568.1 type VI secretion system lipoprotein TssJ [Escherichia coli]EZK17967.1 type IV/VI secretion system, DotU family domain protein [Escherichia coli 2-005-03_S1_C3]EZK53219.1 type IV/VI secretion system, DotU family domain protein [Escherichia coli 2-005-03_S1_C1]KDA64112.1 type IV/VI secretion system, DotU family domain protein [Escherichia coli 2-052-05_S1_C1]KDT17830.1 type IV/VI secretion system, DotU family domain p